MKTSGSPLLLISCVDKTHSALLLCLPPSSGRCRHATLLVTKPLSEVEADVTLSRTLIAFESRARLQGLS